MAALRRWYIGNFMELSVWRGSLSTGLSDCCVETLRTLVVASSRMCCGERAESRWRFFTRYFQLNLARRLRAFSQNALLLAYEHFRLSLASNSLFTLPSPPSMASAEAFLPSTCLIKASQWLTPDILRLTSCTRLHAAQFAFDLRFTS